MTKKKKKIRSIVLLMVFIMILSGIMYTYSGDALEYYISEIRDKDVNASWWSETPENNIAGFEYRLPENAKISGWVISVDRYEKGVWVLNQIYKISNEDIATMNSEKKIFIASDQKHLYVGDETEYVSVPTTIFNTENVRKDGYMHYIKQTLPKAQPWVVGEQVTVGVGAYQFGQTSSIFGSLKNDFFINTDDHLDQIQRYDVSFIIKLLIEVA